MKTDIHEIGISETKEKKVAMKKNKSLFGAPVPRKEDARLLTGRSQYISDLHLPGMLHAAFVRSPLAHAKITSFNIEETVDMEGVEAILTGEDPEVSSLSLRAISELSTYKTTKQPILAWPKVRYCGEPVAVVAATDRYVAEDAAELVDVDYDELPVVIDASTAVNSEPALVHDEAPDNVLVYRKFDNGDCEDAIANAELVVRRTFKTNRHQGAPMEGRACVAVWESLERKLTLYSSTQVPHLVRHGLADVLGLSENQIQVITQDVGGGFGVKAIFYPEDVAICLLAMKTGRPVKWVEDRREGLATNTHSREQRHDIEVAFDSEGHILAVKDRILCDVGAYSVYPWTAGIEPLMAGGLLTGPYKVENYFCETYGVCTNKAPAGPYRGVARPATTFVMERVMDIAARSLNIDPVEIRLRNLVMPEDLPYKSATKLIHDSEAYPVCLDKVLEAIDYDKLRVEQKKLRQQGRYIGIGIACYNELTGLGKKASAGPRMEFRTGHEAMTIRIDPSGKVSVLAGVTSQGQGLETTMAQLVASELGVPLEDVQIHMGDTKLSLFGFGAFASRQAVIGGGAALRTAAAIKEKVFQIAGHILKTSPENLEMEDGIIWDCNNPNETTSLADVANIAYMRSHLLPKGIEPGLEMTRFYDPVHGTFAGGAQAFVVEVLPDTGEVSILRCVCSEDSGKVINPLVVDGQLHGAIAQGIGGVLYEHVRYDEDGQLLSGSLMDYLLPTSAEIPNIELRHVSFPSKNLGGMRGAGEGGTLGPAAGIANAVADALSHLNIEINELPITPSKVRDLMR
ncbi:xanthine dehydrogenase family protein molybdopterin-binding subunit [Bacillus sp. Marseille-P3661]|uniref:xanthine dehydrogenase family protein molybdopterin-binding subunit n=1 Tax=Bacillus sp. Marseille-P3661 TaxID=1936234 RepID=UPI001C641FA6|nr:xanthine dehydrogenase family protein molybdopterin-binding subunit [Bacillus sp. Marseille-P3661]